MFRFWDLGYHRTKRDPRASTFGLSTMWRVPHP
jgi:hypothetical protein